MNRKSISDIVVNTLQLTYLRAIFSVLIIVTFSMILVWMFLIRPGYSSLSAAKNKVKNVLADRSTQLFVSEVNKSVSNINTFFRATEGAIYAISADILSFRGDKSSNLYTLPLVKNFLSKGVYANSVKPNSRHGGTVSYDYPGVYCPNITCYSKTNPELQFLEKYWPQFLTISKRIYGVGPEIQWIYVASESGQIMMYPGLPGIPSGYDPRTRRWYTEALKADGLIWTNPYFAAGGSNLVVTVSKRVDGLNDLSKTVVAIDINIESLISNRLNLPYANEFNLILASVMSTL